MLTAALHKWLPFDRMPSKTALGPSRDSLTVLLARRLNPSNQTSPHQIADPARRAEIKNFASEQERGTTKSGLRGQRRAETKQKPASFRFRIEGGYPLA